MFRNPSLVIAKAAVHVAVRVTESLVDDLDGHQADETVTFDLDGISYTIDLSAANAAGLRAVLAPYIRAGTRVHRPARRTPWRLHSSAENAAVRAWAQSTGHTVSDRGRIRQSAIDAYQAATGSDPPPPAT